MSSILEGLPTVVLVLSSLLLPSILGAQVITGSIVGNVRDEASGVLPGATVTISSPALLPGSATFITNEKGQFRFPSLAPGVYGLNVSLSGFQTYDEQGLRVLVGGTLERNVALKLAGIAENITVTGESPLVNTKKSGHSTNYGSEQVQNIPVSRFSMFDLMKAAPGTSEANTGSSNVSAFGSSANENAFLLNGTDITGADLGYAASDPDPDVIQEIEILSLGAPAEYGNLQGAVFNVVTKQGGNDFQFDASYYGQYPSLTSEGVRLDCECPEGETGFHRALYRDFTAHLGGPILKDRLWFFGGYQYLRDASTGAGAPTESAGTYGADRIFWKINWQVTPKLNLMHSYQDTYSSSEPSVNLNFPYATQTLDDGHNPTTTFANLNYFLSSNTFWELRTSGFYGIAHSRPVSGYTVPPHFDIATGVHSGGSIGFSEGHGSRTTVSSNLTHYATDFLKADHDFKFGAQFTQAENRSFWGYPGGASYTDYAGAPYYAYFRAPYAYGGELLNLGVFADDVLRVSDRLTLNLGLRFDHGRGISPDIPALDPVGDETGGTIPGLGTLYIWNVLSPRLGFNVKLTQDGKTALRANWGRYHQGMYTSELAANHPGKTPLTLAFFDPATGEYSNVVSVLDPIAQLHIDPKTKSPKTDQFSIGLDRELWTDVSVSATYVRKDGRDFIGWRDVGGVYASETATLSDGRTIPVFALVSSPEERYYLLTNPEGWFTRYNGLLLTFEKRWSKRWQALVSYSLSEAVGLIKVNVVGGPQQSTTFGTNSLGLDPNDLTNATGNLASDRTHMFRIQGSVEVPKIEVMVGANFQFLTGMPWAARAFVNLPQGSTRILIEEPGARRLSSQTLLDLRISKILRFDKEGRLEFLVDILNALNSAPEGAVRTANFFSPNFGKPLFYIVPRRAMIGVKVSF